MSDPFQDRPFPRGALIGAGLLIAFTISVAALTRMTGQTETYAPTASPTLSRDLRFEDRADGAIVVTAARDGQVIDVLAAGTNGFTRSTLRGLVRDRRREALSAAPPFRLTQYADGRLTLQDGATGRRVDLEAFGPSNVEVFTHLLTAHQPNAGSAAP
jgi:putative photosynthetic complex assembly protein